MLHSILLAQAVPSAGGQSVGGFIAEHFLVIGVVAVAIFAFSILTFIAKRYRRCPPNRVLVIFGKVRRGEASHCVSGGAAFVWPLIQDHAFLNLEPIQIEIPLKAALSIENIRVNVPSIFTVAVGTEPEVMSNAAIRLLGLDTEEVKAQAEHIIFGQLRQVIASMRIEDINRHREQFLHSIQTSLEPELRKIGLVLINVNITDITDESGYIAAIGKKAASQAIQQASIDVSQQEKMGAIGVAEADREKIIQVANASKLREIGMREAQREQAVRVATLEKEQKVGEQTAAFEREAQVKNAERGMRIATADANAKAVVGENEAKAQIAAAQAGLLVKEAEAYQLGETRKREAEAAVQEAQNRAMAKAALAQAERVEAERRAAVEAPAKAEKAKVIVEAEAEAEKRRIEAEGQAKAIFVKLEAEARGQYEILARKGEGLRCIIEACGGSQQAFQMLLLEHLDALTQASAQAISKIKFDKVVVWENGSNGNGNGATATSHFLQGLARSMPPILQVMKDIGGVEVPDYFAKLTPEKTADGDKGTVVDVKKMDATPAAEGAPTAAAAKRNVTVEKAKV
ncbi:MAG TPA: SPFH domain-containing protein [Gemmataceae bacterium]|jgi:flotillin|nr:SPFH domain-containing protein [Gemmataceae bacterium]